MSENIKQPNFNQQQVLSDIMSDVASEVQIKGTAKKYKIHWLKRGTIRKITQIMLTKGNDDKISCKVAASIILNGYWKIKFMYKFLWRWFYYIKQYGDEQLFPVIEEGKKKIPQESYYYVTILATGMRDTMMTMTRTEIEHFLHEQDSEQQEA